MAGKKRSGFLNDRRAYGNCCTNYRSLGKYVSPTPTSSIPSCATSSGCINGYPINTYANCNLNPFQALYSVWSSYQSQSQAQLSSNLNNAMVPTQIGVPCSGPANIFIIRHGEKANGYGLDQNGIYRAGQLINYICSLANNGYPIAYILTCQPDSYKSGSGSMHPSQLISAASFMLNIPIIMYGTSSDINTIASELYNGQYDGLNVLICWQHQLIQALSLAILNNGAKQPTSRLPTGITTADQFFMNLSPSPLSGNYLCTASSPNSNSNFIDPTPNQNSQYYPYWNINDFNSVYVFNSSASSNYTFGFTISSENINTCFPNCNLHIGLYQPTNGDNYYSNGNNNIENLCQVPTDWSIN